MPSNEDDNVRQYCSVEAPSSTNWNDSDAFDDMMAKHGSTVWNDETAGPWVQDEAMPVRAPKLGLIQSWITVAHWTAEDVKRYLIAGGATTLTAAAAGQNEIERSTQRLVADQADCLYISAHGKHETGDMLLGGGVKLTSEEVDWDDGLDRVFFALCSLLDVLGECPPSPTIKTPGVEWAKTGPKQFFGYRAGGPKDEELPFWVFEVRHHHVPPITWCQKLGRTDEKFTAKIVQQFFANPNKTTPTEWGDANRTGARKNKACWHACVINNTPNMFHYFDVIDRNGDIIYKKRFRLYNWYVDSIKWTDDPR